jgi:hypothetical protein
MRYVLIPEQTCVVGDNVSSLPLSDSTDCFVKMHDEVEITDIASAKGIPDIC